MILSVEQQPGDDPSSSSSSDTPHHPITISDLSTHTGVFITHDGAGRIGSLPGISLTDNVLDLGGSLLSASSIVASTGDIRITTVKNAALLGTDNQGTYNVFLSHSLCSRCSMIKDHHT